jgi:hypothetical protein
VGNDVAVVAWIALGVSIVALIPQIWTFVTSRRHVTVEIGEVMVVEGSVTRRMFDVTVIVRNAAAGPTLTDGQGQPPGMRTVIDPEAAKTWRLIVQPLLPLQVIQARVMLVNQKVVESNRLVLPALQVTEYWEEGML